jgi:WD repeat-containing protein 44
VSPKSHDQAVRGLLYALADSKPFYFRRLLLNLSRWVRKGVSLFSRFIGTKKKDAFGPPRDEPTHLPGELPLDAEAELFSRPIGFLPQFPAPPRYIKVRANNRKPKKFERVFLAQVLLERNQKSKRKMSGDEEIVHVDEVLVSPGQPFNKAIWAMEFSKDGRYLASAGQDKKVRVWAVISSTEEREAHEAEEEEKNPEQLGIRLNAPVLRTKLLREYQGHTSSILDLCWSKNNFLLSSSMDKTVRLWHVSRSECLCAFVHHDFVTSISFHPRDDRFFLAGSLDAKLRLWSIPDKAVAYWVNVPDMVTAVAFTPDGKTCIAGCLNGLCLFYDTEKLKLHSQLHVRSARGRNAKGSKITGIDTITFPPRDPNGDVKLLITSNDSRVRMYNYKDRNLEIKFRGNENTCSQIHATFSDDGRHVICGSEDKRVYIWPTGPIEKQDQDKRPVEILEAHTAIVTSAILAPTKTRQHLAQSGDPIYDLCNPPPVTLVGNDSGHSSRAQSASNPSIKDQAPTSAPQSSKGCRRAEETPAYLARHAHPGGNIIVTADYLGQIKIFRQDCAFQKRRYESFDSSSLFSRTRLLGRNGSVTTRTGSLSSARNSVAYSTSRNPSTDRIINWRNSIATGPTSTPSGTTVSDAHTSLHRVRSDSPRKTSARISSPRHQFDATPPSTTTTTSFPSSHPKSSNESSRVTAAEPENALEPPIIEMDASVRDGPTAAEPDARLSHFVHSADNILYMQGDHSYRYWKQDELAAMAKREPRTPGLLNPVDISSNLLLRKQSVVSRLSSDLSSDETATSGANGDESNEIKCDMCGGRTFRVKVEQKQGTPEQRLSCKRCGNVIERARDSWPRSARVQSL